MIINNLKKILLKKLNNGRKADFFAFLILKSIITPIQLAPEFHTKNTKMFCLKSKHEFHDEIAHKNLFPSSL
jgi:hypothetical protein